MPVSLKDSNTAARIIVKTVSIVLIFTLIFCTLPKDHWNGLNETNDNGLSYFMNRLYFTSTTFSTVGYGDISPNSNLAKFLVILLQFLISIVVLDHLSLNIFRPQAL